MNKFLKNCGLYVAFIAFCIGMISCSSDNEDDMEGYSIRQLLVGEWELDMGESEKVSDFHKLFFKDDEGVLTLREGEAIAYSYPCWMFDPETNVVSLEIAVPVSPNFAGYILYIYKVVSVDSKNLVLRYISESNSRELHYKRVAKYESIAKPENKYKRQDFYGSWEYSYPKVYGNVTYTNKIRSIINFFNKTSQSILILVPSFFDGQGLRGKLNDRMKLKTRFDFEDQFILLDAIDQKEYYDRAKEIDHIITSISSAHKKYDRVTDLLKNLSFKSKDIFPWIRDNHVVKKTKEERELSAELDSLCTSFFTSPSLSGVKGLIDFFSNRLSLTVKLPSVLHAERQCISAAIEKGASVYSCMVEYKNRIRKGGRKIEGSCIGTTLLTKGLEFDNVLVLDAHRIVDKENFYVAISRACKNLVIVSKSPFLSF